jgi:hypothetical protein
VGLLEPLGSLGMFVGELAKALSEDLALTARVVAEESADANE